MRAKCIRTGFTLYISGILQIDHVNRKVTGLKTEYLYVSDIIISSACLSTENLDYED